MQFNSYLFIIVFLPMSIFGYFYLNRISSSFGLIFLLAMSLWFYGYFNIYYLFLCKCAWFSERFGMERLKGVFINEKDVRV